MDPDAIAARLRVLSVAASQEATALSRARADLIVGSEALDDEHDPEGATIAFEREQLAAMESATRERVAEIDLALRRVDEGTYGTCIGCGNAIGAERLAALPAAALCMPCASSPRR